MRREFAAKFSAPKYIRAIKKAPREKWGASPHSFSRRVPAQIGSRRFPDFRPPDFSPQTSRRFPGINLALFRFFRAALPGGFAVSKTRQWGLRVSSAGRLQWRDRGRLSRPSPYPENRPMDDSRGFPASRLNFPN